MNQENIIITEKDLEKIKQFRDWGIIDEVELRDIIIKQKFREKEKEGKKPGKIIPILAEEYNLAVSYIGQIVYKKNSRKKRVSFEL